MFSNTTWDTHLIPFNSSYFHRNTPFSHHHVIDNPPELKETFWRPFLWPILPFSNYTQAQYLAKIRTREVASASQDVSVFRGHREKNDESQLNALQSKEGYLKEANDAALKDEEVDHHKLKELESFANSFKQRRIKLGFTQTNVGKFQHFQNSSSVSCLIVYWLCS